MEFKIEELGELINVDVIRKISNNEVIIRINDKEHKLKILNYDGKEAEFMLNNTYKHVKYLDNNATVLKIQISGKEVATINKFPHLQHIIKSGTTVDTQRVLQSPIPGRVISIEAKPEMRVKKGDVIAILESMKMRVAIKSHKDGVVKEIKIKEGTNVARNDTIAIIE